nr:hypothetical protein Iba_chr01cCG14480 [Ipomoea batatas]
MFAAAISRRSDGGTGQAWRLCETHTIFRFMDFKTLLGGLKVKTLFYGYEIGRQRSRRPEAGPQLQGASIVTPGDRISEICVYKIMTAPPHAPKALKYSCSHFCFEYNNNTIFIL